MNTLFEFDKKIKKADIGALGLNLNPAETIIGTDEAGRGPGAGGVFAAAVCLQNFEGLDELNDSKKLSPKKREELFEIIKRNSVWDIQTVEVDLIEKNNILSCSLLAMERAVLNVLKKVNGKNPLVLVDGNRKIPFEINQRTVVKGDMKSASIAAASVLAKVERDFYMCKLHEKHPQYNWAKNKGYLTKEHIEAIKKYGICEFHRKSFLSNIIK